MDCDAFHLIDPAGRVFEPRLTEKGAAIMRGKIIAESGIEIDADRLEPGEEWTARDFVP